jgi:predicted RNA-binding protein with TRAM domain
VRVEHGYVVIVLGSSPGDELTVEIEVGKQNFAMAEIIDGDKLTYE